MKRKHVVRILLLIWLFIIVDGLSSRPICRFYIGHELEIATVTRGEFVEYTPANGTLDVSHDSQIKIEISRVYRDRIKPGLIAVCETDTLMITEVGDDIYDYRFVAWAKFKEPNHSVDVDETLRLRIILAPPRQAVLLPHGRYRMDTGGKWILVTKNDRARKRKIVLGPHNSEYFEVLEGLNEGEQVITSAYEHLPDQDVFHLEEIRARMAGWRMKF